MINICDSHNPYFLFENNKWILNPKHQFNIRDYFTPKMDEAYNLSFWRGPLFKKIRTKLQTEYCKMKNDPIFQERIKYYQTIDKENLNDRLISEYISNQDRFLRVKEDIENSCDQN